MSPFRVQYNLEVGIEGHGNRMLPNGTKLFNFVLEAIAFSIKHCFQLMFPEFCFKSSIDRQG